MKKTVPILTLIGAMALSSCGKNHKENKNDIYINNLELLSDSTKKNIKSCIEYTAVSLSPEEKIEEEKLQKSFYEEYAKDYSTLYGDRLYRNEELLCPEFNPPNFNLVPYIRLLQYFFRNGKTKTFEVADELGCKYHQTILSENDPIATIFKDAGIDITGKAIQWIEVPESTQSRSGGLYRKWSKYGGKDELIMTVTNDSLQLDKWIGLPAKEAGYYVDLSAQFYGAIANEISHEIQDTYFSRLFSGEQWDNLTEPFQSFTTEIPWLRFKSNAQAGEFLSDVADWNTGAPYWCSFRFFNPLYYMSGNRGGEESRYWYSYQVQKYAMESILKKKGYKNYKTIMQNLIKEADNSNYKNHNDLFMLVRQYFNEEDFKEIAKVYRKIGVQLLKEMQPYFGKE